MFYFYVLLFCASVSSAPMNEVDRKCIEKYNETFSNDFLLGSWFQVYKFTLFDNLIPSWFCLEVKFEKPTAEVLRDFKKTYNDTDRPYSFDDNPVTKDDSCWQGIVVGNKKAKFYVHIPEHKQFMGADYDVYVFRPLNDKYMMFHRCALREHSIWLYSRERNPPLEEMEEVIKKNPKLNRMAKQRYCDIYKGTDWTKVEV